MMPELDPRYRVTGILGQHEDRLACEAEDLLTGRLVVLKTGPRPQMLHELAALLTLPPRVGPEVLDAVWTGNARILLVLERLRGRTLSEAAATLSQDSIPGVVRAFSKALLHMHRAGIVHVDLKPSNMLLLDGRETAPEIRLLDFGFAHRASGGPFPDEDRHGGTLPYLAPEVQRGWAFDGRADLYSLGETLREAFPQAMAGADWSAILTRLTDPSPSRRFADALALRIEIEDRFSLRPLESRFPRLGGGPMHGRGQAMAKLLEHLRAQPPAARVLLCAMPGTGLSRFMLEGLMSVARAQGPATRLLDIGGGLDMDANRATDFLRDRTDAGETVLCGVADLSPGLHWLSAEMAAAVRRSWPAYRRPRFHLQSPDVGTFAEATARVLGSGGATVERVAESLWRRTEGNFRHAADGLEAALKHCECDGEWGSIDSRALLGELASWSPPEPQPAFDRVPAELRSSLQLCARAGRSFPRSLAEGLLARFHNPDTLDALLERGFLQDEGTGRLAFLTRHLRRAALEEPLQDERDVSTWLNARSDPAIDRPEEILEACARARLLGGRQREAQLLGEALAYGYGSRNWSDLRRLLEHPEGPASWSAPLLRQRVDELHALLAETWTRPKLALVAAEAFLDVAPTAAEPLLEEVAAGSSAEAAEALVLLLERDIARNRDESFAAHLRALETLEHEGHGPRPGVIDRIRGLRDQSRGRLPEAETAARRALRALEGSGTLQENLARQLLAVLRFYNDPDESIVSLQRVLDASSDREQVAQAAHNLALMLAQTGDPEAAVRTAERGIAALDGRGISNRLIQLRARRAWSLANLDRAAMALSEAQDLLERAAVRQNPTQRVVLRLLVGFCHLHQGTGRSAIIETARAWEDARGGCALELQLDALAYLVDVLLDLEAWDLVRSEGSSLMLECAPAGERGRVIAARVRSLCARAAERWEDAVAPLADLQPEARIPSMRIYAARYLHQGAVTRMAAARHTGGAPQIEKATQLLEDAISLLQGPAYGYYRGRSLLALSMAFVASGEHERARRTLADSIELARRLDCRGLLADALRTRARMDLSSGPPTIQGSEQEPHA